MTTLAEFKQEVDRVVTIIDREIRNLKADSKFEKVTDNGIEITISSNKLFINIFLSRRVRLKIVEFANLLQVDVDIPFLTIPLVNIVPLQYSDLLKPNQKWPTGTKIFTEHDLNNRTWWFTPEGLSWEGFDPIKDYGSTLLSYAKYIDLGNHHGKEFNTFVTKTLMHLLQLPGEGLTQKVVKTIKALNLHLTEQTSQLVCSYLYS